MLWWRGMNRAAVVLALALGVTYGNAVMIGIPLVQLAWGGDAGLVTLLTLIPIHSLVLLTAATVVLEFALAREHSASRTLVRPECESRVNSFFHPRRGTICGGLNCLDRVSAPSGCDGHAGP